MTAHCLSLTLIAFVSLYIRFVLCMYMYIWCSINCDFIYTEKCNSLEMIETPQLLHTHPVKYIVAFQGTKFNDLESKCFWCTEITVFSGLCMLNSPYAYVNCLWLICSLRTPYVMLWVMSVLRQEPTSHCMSRQPLHSTALRSLSQGMLKDNQILQSTPGKQVNHQNQMLSIYFS